MPDGSPGARSNRAPLSIIIPAYNEEAIFASNIERFRAYLKDRDSSGFETILASNGSTGRTVEFARESARAHDDLPYFRKAQRPAPLSNTAVHSTYYESIILYREKDWVEAEKAFQRLIDYFPEAAAAAESLYHIGLCRARRDDAKGAVQAWQDTQRIYPGTQWAGYAGQRLAEVSKDPGS